MIVYPAIDISGGKVVRLRQGDPSQMTTYGDDPVEVAGRWRDAGARWIHVVNIDGALAGAAFNLGLLSRIALLGLSIQFGGGLRSLDDARLALEAGAGRAVLGTLIAQNPALAGEAVTRFGAEAVAVALDAKDGKVATHGWRDLSLWSPVELGRELKTMGLKHALFTDVSRDGEMRGVNVATTAELARKTGLEVIASGGVASLADLAALKNSGAPIAGVIIGKALYSGAFTLEEALQMMGGADAG